MSASSPSPRAEPRADTHNPMAERTVPTDIAGLRAAYAQGLDPAAVVDHAFDAIEAAADPGIFILLLDRETVRARPPDNCGLRSVKPNRCGASRSRSRTTSTSPGCRPRPPARLRLHARGERDGRAAAARRRRAADRQDQSRPVRDRPGRRAHALSGAEECRSIRRSCRADRARARRWRWRAGSCRSRSAPIRRDRAGCRPASTTSSGSSPRSARCRPAAWCRPAARSTACRCSPAPSTMPGRSTRSIAGHDAEDPFSRAVALGDPGAAPPHPRSACRAPADLKFFGDERGGGRLAPRACEMLQGSARSWSTSIRAVVRDRGAALRGAVGGRALRGHPRPSWSSAPSEVHPVTRADHREGAAASPPPMPSPALYRLAGAEAREEPCGRHRCADGADGAVSPTLAEVAADPIGPNARLGTYTNFVNLLDLAANGRAGPIPNGRAGGRRHLHWPARP